MKRTPRGFNVYGEYKDSRDNTIRVQESSAAGGPYCWIFTKNALGEDGTWHMGQIQAASPHLTRTQARRVAEALLKFANGGEP